MGLIDKARDVFARRKKKGDLWKWAREPKRMARRAKRWQALARFATKQRKLSRAAGNLAKAHAWAEARTVYRKKFKFLKKKLEKRRAEHDHGGGDGVGYANPVASWNPYRRDVAEWMVPWLDKSRAAGWGGVVVSGVRTAAHSQSLCCTICHACAPYTTCPGRCAGYYSNHNMEPNQGYPHGAIDVSDYWNFAAIQSRIGSPLRNDLPLDRVHFSVSGH